MPGMLLLVSEILRKVQDAVVADVVEGAAIGPLMRLFDGVENNSFPECKFRHGHFLDLEFLEDLFEDQRPRNDDVGSARVEPVDLRALLGILCTDDLLDDRLELVTGK